MSVTILTIESELESAERLGFATDLELDPSFDGTVIRWGNSTIYGGREFSRVVNPAESIALNVHKLNALRKLSNVVKTPRAFVTKVPSGVTALLRSIKHGEEATFKIVKGPHDVPNDHYATTWIHTDLEYRVWFAWDKTITAKRVPIDGDEEQAEEKNSEFPCRREWGYKFIDSTPQALHTQVLRAAREIGLTLGAADVLVRGGEFIFLELNSAPSIDHRRLEEFFVRHINHRLRPARQTVQV